MMRRLVIAALVAAALVVAGAAGAVALFRAYPVRMSLFAAMTRNYLRSLSAPKGATTTELNPAPCPLYRQRNAKHRIAMRKIRRSIQRIDIPAVIPALIVQPLFLAQHVVGELQGVTEVQAEMTFSPPWTPERMSEDAKFALGF